MLCKNCNYILTGKENFCPNCASALTEKASQTLKNQEEQQQKDKQKERIAEREYVFPEKEATSYDAPRDSRIFYEPPEQGDWERPPKKKERGGRLVLTLLLICVLVAGGFAAIDYFGITPSVFSFLKESQTSGQAVSTTFFSHESSIIKPDISYTPERAYIMSGEGLSLRKGPGKEYAPMGVLDDLTAVIIYGGNISRESWAYIYCPEKECYGWLDGSFLTKGEKEEGTTLFAENDIADEEETTESTTAAE